PSAETNNILQKTYAHFEPSVVNASIHCAKQKLSILEEIASNSFLSSLEVREKFYKLQYNFPEIEKKYIDLKATIDKKTFAVGALLSEKTYSAQETANKIRNEIEMVKSQISETILFPKSLIP